MNKSEKLLGQLIIYSIFISEVAGDMTVKDLKDWLSEVFPREMIDKTFDNFQMTNDEEFAKKIGGYYELS